MVGLWWMWMGCSSSPPPPPQNVLLIVVDTLRADVVAEVDTPVLDALAAEGSQVARAWSAGTWTVPSVISLFSGTSIREHGWNFGSRAGAAAAPVPDTPLLAEVLQQAGFRTHGLYANEYLTTVPGFGRGFDTWKQAPESQLLTAAEKVLQTWAPDDRNFLYVHMIAPHSPLKPSKRSAEKYAVHPSFLEDQRGFLIGVCKRDRIADARKNYAAAYRAVVEDVDTRIGEFLDTLGPHRDKTAIIVTSDHGELLGEHGVCGHGDWVHEELTHVPLIGVGVGTLPDTLGIASIPAVITEAVGVSHDWATPSTAALPLVSIRESWFAISPDGTTKGIWDRKGPRIVDLSTGSVMRDPDVYEQMKRARTVWEAEIVSGMLPKKTAPLTDETRERLKALGYVTESP